MQTFRPTLSNQLFTFHSKKHMNRPLL
jgi:hypothetical protein